MTPVTGVRRIGTILVAFLAPLISAIFVLDAFRPSDEPSAESITADVAELDCAGSDPVVTPEVALQADGLHVRVLREPDTPTSVEIRMGDTRRNVVRMEFEPGGDAGHVEVLRTRAGEATVVCLQGDGDEARTTATAAMTIVDPHDVWRADSLDCGGRPVPMVDHYSFFAASNPITQGVARAVPGILPTDVVQAGGIHARDAWSS
jgi:hypothetical protein